MHALVVYSMFDQAQVNLNLLIILINRKFFDKKSLVLCQRIRVMHALVIYSHNTLFYILAVRHIGIV